MTLRTLAAVATALVCAVATPSTAGGTITLDGVRRTNVQYDGELTELAWSTDGSRVTVIDPFEPYLEDCQTSASCDITALRVTLPKGTTAGKLKVVVTLPRQMNGAVALFDAEGTRVAKGDIVENAEPLCCEVPNWKVSFTVGRLPAGKYSLVVFDRGGNGRFTLDATFRANPPDRLRGR